MSNYQRNQQFNFDQEYEGNDTSPNYNSNFELNSVVNGPSSIQMMKKTSSIKRIFALSMIQWHIQRRKYLQICCMLLFPVAIMILPVIISLIAFSRKAWGSEDYGNRFYYSDNIFSMYNCECVPNNEYCIYIDRPPITKFTGFKTDFLFQDKTPAGDDSLIEIPFSQKTGTGFWGNILRSGVNRYYLYGSKCGYGPSFNKYDGDLDLDGILLTNAKKVFDCSKGEGLFPMVDQSCMVPEFAGHGIVVNRLNSSELKMEADIISNEPNLVVHFILSSMIKAVDRVGVNSTLLPKFGEGKIVFDFESPLTILQSFADTTILLIYPGVVSFLFPIFLSSYIQDRNLGVIDFIQLFGVEEWEESLVRFGCDMIIYLVYVLINFLFCVLSQMVIFQKTYYLIIPAVILYGYIQIHIAYTISPLFKNTSQSSPIGFLLVGFFCLIGSLLNLLLYDIINLPPWWYLIFPPFVFIRCIALAIGMNTELKVFKPNIEQFLICIGILILQSIFFTFTAYGVFTKLPKFITKLLIHTINNYRYKQKEELAPLLDSETVNVKQEKQKILNNEIGEDVILVANDLCKVFGTGKKKRVAVNHLFISMSRGQCFGLIGSNGSGKTTTISMITGTLNPTSGTATVCGFDIRKQRKNVLKCIGILPQFEILWPTVTVEEHLYFYARLRGVPYKEQYSHVKSVLEEIGLEEARRRSAKNLSGGMKRRLGLAIAITGSPPLLLLDEPSSGLDAASARGMWELILNAKKSRCVVLTSHSMHEVETLCERIGMLANGNLVCVGDLLDLKKHFTDGYKLKISCELHNIDRAKEYIANEIPFAEFVQDLGAGNLLYRIKSSSMKLATLFANMQFSKLAQFGIRDWNLDQASLDEIFMKFSTNHDSEQ